MRDHWNTHYIRKSRYDTVPGRPVKTSAYPQSSLTLTLGAESYRSVSGKTLCNYFLYRVGVSGDEFAILRLLKKLGSQTLQEFIDVRELEELNKYVFC